MPRACAAVTAAILASLLSQTGGAATNPTRPALRLLRVSPLTVTGLHFAPRHHVRISVLAPSPQLLILTTTATGTFTARFPNLTLDRCTSLETQATGAHQQRALLTLKAHPLCPPP
jgi:hypothetical protein